MAVKKKAGHRSWSPKGGKVPGRHTGDIMPPETRSRVMSQIKAKGTKPELWMEESLRAEGEAGFEKHVSDLPGKPDFVFRGEKVIVFVDGDFWHGYRFPLWEHKLSQKWREKIAATRARDQRNFRKLRRMGWHVIRIWEHQLERDALACSQRVAAILTARRTIV